MITEIQRKRWEAAEAMLVEAERIAHENYAIERDYGTGLAGTGTIRLPLFGSEMLTVVDDGERLRYFKVWRPYVDGPIGRKFAQELIDTWLAYQRPGICSRCGAADDKGCLEYSCPLKKSRGGLSTPVEAEERALGIVAL